ncbi:unnamed protein product [Parajaminaea phylloscopi]
MPNIPIASNVLGTIGTILWCLQIVPQIIKNHRARSTFGLSPWLLVCWASASVPQGAYLLIEWVSVPLLIQPQIFSALALIGVGQCLYYRDGGEQVGSRVSRNLTVVLVLAAWIFYGAVEFAFFELGRLGKRRGTEAASQVFGILGVIGILGGLLPQYWEIYKLGRVVGISLMLLIIDSAGAVFSLLALIFKPTFDGLAAANYIGILVLEIGIFALWIILNPRAARQERGKTQDVEGKSRDAEGDTSSRGKGSSSQSEGIPNEDTIAPSEHAITWSKEAKDDSGDGSGERNV